MEKLVCLLEEHKTILERLTTIALDERESLCKRDIKTLQETLLSREQLLSSLSCLEKKRVKLTGDNNLNEILDGTSAEYRNIISDLYTKLEDLAGELRILNNANETIIKYELSYVKNFQGKCDTVSKPSPYNRIGLISKIVPESLLVSSIA